MEEKRAKVCIVVAIGETDRAIGKGGKLLWHIPDDLRHFKKLTMGHPVILGRKTFDSIVSYLGGPLPGRTNIVVTRNNLCLEGALVSHSLEEALVAGRAIDQEEILIAGGSEIYKEALPFTDRLYLTLIHDTKDADTFFPDYSEFKTVVEKEEREHNGLKYTWLTLER